MRSYFLMTMFGGGFAIQLRPENRPSFLFHWGDSPFGQMSVAFMWLWNDCHRLQMGMSL